MKYFWRYRSEKLAHTDGGTDGRTDMHTVAGGDNSPPDFGDKGKRQIYVHAFCGIHIFIQIFKSYFTNKYSPGNRSIHEPHTYVKRIYLNSSPDVIIYTFKAFSWNQVALYKG